MVRRVVMVVACRDVLCVREAETPNTVAADQMRDVIFSLKSRRYIPDIRSDQVRYGKAQLRYQKSTAWV